MAVDENIKQDNVHVWTDPDAPQAVDGERLEQIAARCKAATFGPWVHKKVVNPLNDLGKKKWPNGEIVPLYEHWIVTDWVHAQLKNQMPIVTISSGPYHEDSHTIRIKDEDGDFIAAARNDVRDLVAALRGTREAFKAANREITRLQDEVERLQKARELADEDHAIEMRAEKERTERAVMAATTVERLRREDAFAHIRDMNDLARNVADALHCDPLPVAIEKKAKELRAALSDEIDPVAALAGPCQAGLIERCRCETCRRQRSREALGLEVKRS